MKVLLATLATALIATLALTAFTAVEMRRDDRRVLRLTSQLTRIEHRLIETKDAACLAYEFASGPAISHADELPVCHEANSVAGTAFQLGREWPGEPGYDRRTGNPITTP